LGVPRRTFEAIASSALERKRQHLRQRLLPAASIASRSKPSATPAQSGKPAANAANKCSSTGMTATPRLPHRIFLLEPAALFDRITQLVKAVGQLDAVQIQLKAFADRRIARPQPRQRRLRGRIVV
jgi:hypothetical protein